MARQFNGTNEYLEVNSAVLTAVPITMACWFNSDSASAFQVLMSIVDSSQSDEMFRLVLAGDEVGDPVNAVARQTGTNTWASTTAGYSTGTWQHACGVWSANNARAAYLDGANKGTDVVASTPTGMDRTSIGRVGDSSPGSYMDGEIAEAGVWNVALSDAEVAMLAKGFSPLLVRPQSLVAYWKLVRSEDQDVVGGFDMTAFNTPTIAAHPSVLYPISPQVVAKVAAVVSVATAAPIVTASHHQSLGLSVLAFKPEIGSYTVRGTLFDDQIASKMDGLSFEKHADGGWWSAQIALNARLTDAERWFEEGLNLNIEIYNPALVRIFRGFVNQVDLSAGALSATRGPVLDVVNRISMTYTPLLDATISPPIYGSETTTAITEDADSQAEFGIIEKVFGAEPGRCLQSQAEQQQDTFLEELKDARTSEDAGFSAQNVTQIVLNVLGYRHRLGTYIHQNTTAATVQLSTKIQQVLASDPNSLFSTDYSNIDTNAFLVNQFEDDNRVGDDVIRDLVEIGGAATNNRYLFGIYDEEKAHYNAIPTEALYQHRIADKFRRIERFGTGELVRPWDVKPGEFLFFPDFLIGRTQPTDLRKDPRYLFIESVSFSTPYEIQINGAQLSTIPQLLAKARNLE
jgi:uncharacterized protein (DUF2267 family)